MRKFLLGQRQIEDQLLYTPDPSPKQKENQSIILKTGSEWLMAGGSRDQEWGQEREAGVFWQESGRENSEASEWSIRTVTSMPRKRKKRGGG